MKLAPDFIQSFIGVRQFADGFKKCNVILQYDIGEILDLTVDSLSTWFL